MKKIYLAIPYSGMQESSYNQANEAAVSILKSDNLVYSPITSSHVLAGSDPDLRADWGFWSRLDLSFIDWADELWVLVPKEGVEKVTDSIGVTDECIYASQCDKPVHYVELNNDKNLVKVDIHDYYIIKD